MRTTLLLAILFAPGFAVAQDKKAVAGEINAVLNDAEHRRWEAMRKADREYRVAVSKTFKFADRVEVFLLDFSMGSDPAFAPKEDDKVFEIRPSDGKTKIIKSAEVPSKDVPTWREAAAKLCSAEQGNLAAGCHYPIHGIRLYAGDEVLFETSLCWKCNNYQFHYGLDGSGWVVMNDDAGDLKTLLHELMPIPESEKQRFDGPRTNWKGGVF